MSTPMTTLLPAGVSAEVGVPAPSTFAPGAACRGSASVAGPLARGICMACGGGGVERRHLRVLQGERRRMTWLPWAVVFVRHLAVGFIRALGPEPAWREHCATVRRHWRTRP